jgi:DNA-nicking Smr family endonuclease
MTRRRRETTSEERALFHAGLDSPAVLQLPRKKSAAKLSAAAALSHPAPKRHTPAIDGSTAEKLRRGRLEPEARLDLHGLTETVAHRALANFLRHAHAAGLRLVLVVTGKGVKPMSEAAPFDLGPGARGVLRTMVPRWLKEPEFAFLTVDVRTAHRRHGGAGALYVYLRKAQR